MQDDKIMELICSLQESVEDLGINHMLYDVMSFRSDVFSKYDEDYFIKLYDFAEENVLQYLKEVKDISKWLEENYKKRKIVPVSVEFGDCSDTNAINPLGVPYSVFVNNSTPITR